MKARLERRAAGARRITAGANAVTGGARTTTHSSTAERHTMADIVVYKCGRVSVVFTFIAGPVLGH
eukprot:2311275-Prymnesium_polylepis.1